MPHLDRVAPHIVVCGGEAAEPLAEALRLHAGLVESAGDYVADGVRVGTGHPARLAEMGERGAAIVAELDRLGLPQQRETGDLFGAAAPGTLFVLALDLAAMRRTLLRHKHEDWLFDLFLEGDDATLLIGDEASLHAAMESGAVRVATEHRSRVVDLNRHLRDAYECVAPSADEDILWHLRYIAECIPHACTLVLVVPAKSGSAEITRLPDEFDYLGLVTADTTVGEDDDLAWLRLAEQVARLAESLPARASAPLSRRRLRRVLEEARAEKTSVVQAADYAKAGYEVLLHAEPQPERLAAIIRALADGATSFAEHLRALAASEDFAARWIAAAPPPIAVADIAEVAEQAELAEMPDLVETQPAEALPEELPAPRTVITTFLDQRSLRTPQELSLTPLQPKRVLIVGSCLSAGLARRMELLPEPCESDLFFLGTTLPAQPPRAIDEYDFQLVQLGLRLVLPDTSFARIAQNDDAEHKRLFARASAMLVRQFDLAMRWNREHGLLTFVLPFLLPAQNLIGRLLPRFELRNAVYFVERLNQVLAEQVAGCSNTYYFDINEINSYYGRRFVQDDILTQFNHNHFIGNYDAKYDSGRLEDAGRATEFFVERVGENFRAFWNELVGLYRTARQLDPVKMVVVDLDDTLWRGVLGDQDLEDLPTSEGWPKGLWEALLILKRRGILLAVISKNDETRVAAAWETIFRKHLFPEDFVVREINWEPKTENMQRTLGAVNVLPRNVLYIDDNPVERAAMGLAYPEMRMLGGSPLLWRRILLWAPETQVAVITGESAKRSSMVRAQISREQDRLALSRDEFLSSLGVVMSLTELHGVEHPRFTRALELINKTNQFNTTGKRWQMEECKAHFAAGHVMLSFEVADHYTDYGLVGVLILRGETIAQFVMSCRVLGLGVESAAVALAGEWLIRRGAKTIFATMVETERNQPCREVYTSCGFVHGDDRWTRGAEDWLAIPHHVEVKTKTQVSAQFESELA